MTSRWTLALAAWLSLTAVPALAKTVVCPGASILPGIDVSVWQGTIDWAKVKAAGKKYAIMRAAHGLAVDTKFATNWKQCHAQGLHCGVYQYFEPNYDAVAQANLTLKTMGKLQDGDLAPTIDVESTGGKSPAVVAAAVGKWIATVEKATGRKVIIYTGAYFWDDHVKSSAFTSQPLWHAQYCTNCCPNIATPWKKWVMWQHSSTGKVGGISGNVDLDKYNGTAADLTKFTDDPTKCTAKCDGTSVVKADCTKVDCAKSAGLCVADSLGVRCISKYCPAKGDKAVCVPSKNDALLGTCSDGKLTTGDCSKYGAFCSAKAGPQAKCVSAFCAKSPADKPAVKDVCLPDGIRYACSAAGDITKKPCAAGTDCAMVSGAAVCQAKTCKLACQGGKLIGEDCKTKDCAALPGIEAGTCVADAKGPRCVAKICPALGAAKVCLADAKNLAIGACQDGAVSKASCAAGSEWCVPATGGAVCAAMACVTDPSKPPIEHTFCDSSGLLVHCDAKGKASAQPCPAGQSCVLGVTPALCLSPAPIDAGTPDVATADAGGEDTKAMDSDGKADGDAAGTDLDAPEDESTEPTADAAEPMDAPDDTPEVTADLEPDVKTINDAATLTSNDAQDDVMATVSGGVAPAGGCHAGSGGSSGAGLLLVAVAWWLRRRRA